ncbi:MAG: XRE family transcriptional regulator [Eubacteriales bacterium]|nr:XRE family transcriptional regulator [Eubacteriales bacterium]
MSYYLKNFDEILLEFTIGKTGLEERVTEIYYVNEEKKHLLPAGLELSVNGLTKWLQRRSIPKNRAFVHEILAAYGLKQGDFKGIIDICKGLSVNDSYWIVDSEFKGSFQDYNLYDNSFSEALALVAYTGYNTSIRELSTSPEFTTAGMLPKAWRRINGEIFLYKGGTRGFANSGMEPYSEFYASQIAERMNLHHVSYGLEQWKGILASTCKLFSTKDVSYVPAGLIVKEGGMDAVIDFYRRLGEACFEELASMLVFDALIYNEDRHYGNFGLLRDSHTGEYIGCAPIFDNGYSLFATAMKSDLEKINAYAEERSYASCGILHDELVKNLCGPRQQEQLRHMINFKFARHSQYNLPEERLVVLESFINQRVEELLKMPKKIMPSP